MAVGATLSINVGEIAQETDLKELIQENKQIVTISHSGTIKRFSFW
ncbi:MAG: hypothetical protein U5R06_22585 [candidate division KSB1 bacterium]|nr:hypothetical protein [candidate division KSB1 bacterium]